MYRWNFKHAGIENSEEYINQSEEKIKQDCESKAFVRLAKKIKESFLRLPIIITADGLYASQKVIQICTDNGWDYIIRYKEGCAPSIAREYQALPEKEKIGSEIEYQNEIIFQNTDVNLIYYTESPGRWKIENQGFNRQKHWQGNIEHACSWNEQAQIYTHFFRRGISVIIQCG